MVLKIQRPAERTDGFSPPPPLPPASGEASSYRDDSIVDRLEPRAQFHGAAPSLPPLPPPQRHHRANLVSRSRDPRDVSHPHGGGRVSRSDYQRCDGCGISDKHAPGSLLLFDDPEEEVDQYAPKRPEDEKRYVSNPVQKIVYRHLSVNYVLPSLLLVFISVSAVACKPSRNGKISRPSHVIFRHVVLHLLCLLW